MTGSTYENLKAAQSIHRLLIIASATLCLVPLTPTREPTPFDEGILALRRALTITNERILQEQVMYHEATAAADLIINAAHEYRDAQMPGDEIDLEIEYAPHNAFAISQNSETSALLAAYRSWKSKQWISKVRRFSLPSRFDVTELKYFPLIGEFSIVLTGEIPRITYDNGTTQRLDTLGFQVTEVRWDGSVPPVELESNIVKLLEVWDTIKDSTVSDAPNRLARAAQEMRAAMPPSGDVTFLGLSFDAGSAIIIGPTLIAFLMLYLLALLKNLIRTLERDGANAQGFPWLGLFGGALGRLLNAATLIVAPLGSCLWLVHSAGLSAVLTWSVTVVLTAVLLALGVALIQHVAGARKLLLDKQRPEASS